MFGFEPAAAFTHHVETAFDRVRQGKTTPSRELISAALRARDHIRLLIENPDEADAAEEQALLASLNASLLPDRTDAPTAETPPTSVPSAGGERIWRIRVLLPRDIMTNGGNPLLLLEELRSLGSAVVTPNAGEIPPLQEIDPTACYLGWTITLKTERPRSEIEDVFIFVRDEMNLEIEDVSSLKEPAAPAAPLKVEATPPAAKQPEVKPSKAEDAPPKALQPPPRRKTSPAETQTRRMQASACPPSVSTN